MQPRVTSGLPQDNQAPLPGRVMTFAWLPGMYQVVSYTISAGIIHLSLSPADPVAQEHARTHIQEEPA